MRKPGALRAATTTASSVGGRALPRPRADRSILVAGAGLGLAVLVAGAAYVAGPTLVLGALALGLVGLLLLAHARWALALYVVVVVVCENNADWGVPILERAYLGVVRDFAPVDFLLAASLVGTVLLAVRRRALRTPSPFGLPLAFMLLVYVFGVLNGVLGGDSQSFQVLGTSLSYAPLFIVPLVVVNLVGPGADLPRVLGRLAALTIVKAFLGLFVVYAGIALVAGPGLPPLTYYEPTSNLLLLTLVLCVLTATVAGISLPRWLSLLSIVAAVCLVLSYRRTFWLAGLLCVAIVIVVAGRRTTRRLILPTLLVALGLGFVVVRGGLGADVSGPIATRVESITPSKVSSNDQDRYRLTERRNVLAEIRRRPITGIGVGVPWETRYPVNLQIRFLDFYTHTAVLWQWLKNGVLGAVTYVWLMIAAITCGVRVFRRHADPRVRAFGLGGGIAFVGLSVVEAASTVVGPDVRGTLVVGLLLGLLAVAHRGLQDDGAAGSAPMIGR